MHIKEKREPLVDVMTTDSEVRVIGLLGILNIWKGEVEEELDARDVFRAQTNDSIAKV